MVNTTVRGRDGMTPLSLKSRVSTGSAMVTTILGRFAAGILVFVTLSAAPVGAAESLPKPTGAVILTVSGKIAETNAPGRADFDREMLESLGKATIKTSTPWTEGAPTFEGVPLAKLLAAVGATGTTLRAVALNDYKSALPAKDAGLGVLLALKINGAPMRVRDKGPIWIIYPLDQNPALRTETTQARMVWQRKSIVVE